MRGEPMQHSAPGFQKPVAGEQSPTSFHLNPLYPGHATRSTQLTTGLSPWLPQFPPSISTLAGYQPVMFHLVLLVLIAALKNHFTNLLFHDSLMAKMNVICVCFVLGGGTRWRSWLMHCATSRKVPGSIPDGVTGIFH